MPEGSAWDGSSAMTVHDVAVYLNVDEKTVYRLAKRGELPGFKVAGTWRFKKQDIDHWIEQRKALPTTRGRERTGGPDT
jgi:excisionase family DNA binding protein